MSKDFDEMIKVNKYNSIALNAYGYSLALHKLHLDKSEKLIGEVTSGTFSPILKKGIGLAYIEKKISSKGIYLKIRNNFIKLEVVKTPFI